MGEKLLAQRVLVLLRETVGKNSREAEAALGWARDNRDWLWPGREWAASDDGGIDWNSLAPLAGEIDVVQPEQTTLGSLARVADLLELGEFDRGLLSTVAALEHLPRLANLRVAWRRPVARRSVSRASSPARPRRRRKQPCAVRRCSRLG